MGEGKETAVKKSRVIGIFLFVLLCCLLSGCGSLPKNERMDQVVEYMIDALNEDDADRIFRFLYPDVVTREEFDESYEAIRDIWEKTDSYTKKLNSINTQKTINNSGKSLVCEAQYYIYTEDKFYTINLTYLSDDNGYGLYGFYLKPGAEPMMISGDFTTARENSVLQWIILFLGALSYFLIIITVVDILRKRPRLFGLWLIAVMAFFSFQIRNMPDNFFVVVGVNWFVISGLRGYNNNGWILFLAIPAGAIVYWCLRKKLLAQKNVSEPPKNVNITD